MNNLRSKLGVVVIGLLILAAFVTLVTHLTNKPLSYTISQSYSPSSGFSAVAPFGSDSLVYSDGQALMAYNYASGKSTALSPVVGLSGAAIDSVSVSENNQFILFHDEQVSSNGALYRQLVGLGLSPQQDYWWLYNVAKQSFYPLPQSTLLAKMAGNDVEALMEATSGESLTAYDTTSLTAESTINIPGSSNFFVTNSGFLLQSPDNQILSTKNGVVSQVVASNATMVGVLPDGRQAVVVFGQGDARQLTLLNLVNHTRQIIANDIVGEPAWSPSGTVLYTISGTNPSSTTLYSYDLTSHKDWLWHFSGSASWLNNSPLTPIMLAGAETAVVGNNSNDYYLIGPALKQPE